MEEKNNHFKVYQQPCRNCLFSKNRIVSEQRKRKIIETCIREQTYFVCHKSSETGGEICCRNFYDKYGHFSQMIRIAERLGTIDFKEQT